MTYNKHDGILFEKQTSHDIFTRERAHGYVENADMYGVEQLNSIHASINFNFSYYTSVYHWPTDLQCCIFEIEYQCRITGVQVHQYS